MCLLVSNLLLDVPSYIRKECYMLTMTNAGLTALDSKCPEEPTTRGGGMLTTECPDCSDDLGVSLPCCADIISIIAHSRSEKHDTDRGPIERPREHQTQCANGHTLSILYDW